MSQTVLAVRTNELRKLLGSRPFVALPREEVDRLHASIEVHTMDHEAAERDPSITQLAVFAAIHHNYSWLTCRDVNDVDQRSVGFTCHIQPDDCNGLFLDDSLKTSVAHVVDANVAVQAGYDLRLSGLLCDDSTPFGRGHLGMVYVVKLRQPGVIDRRNGESRIQFCGMGDLRQDRDRFGTWSRMLIDHLVAL